MESTEVIDRISVGDLSSSLVDVETLARNINSNVSSRSERSNVGPNDVSFLSNAKESNSSSHRDESNVSSSLSHGRREGLVELDHVEVELEIVSQSDSFMSISGDHEVMRAERDSFRVLDLRDSNSGSTFRDDHVRSYLHVSKSHGAKAVSHNSESMALDVVDKAYVVAVVLASCVVIASES